LLLVIVCLLYFSIEFLSSHRALDTAPARQYAAVNSAEEFDMNSRPYGLPVWPEAYCLDDRASDVFLGHWLTITVAGLWDRIKPQWTVVLYAPWLDPSTGHHVKAYHNETIELLKPDFLFINREQRGFEGCLPWGGLDLYHNDRLMPSEGLDFLREHFLRKLSLVPRADAAGLYYFTRKGGGEGGIKDRFGMERRRQIENEDALLPGLLAMGFRLIHLEDYSFEEKIRLFAGARLAVGPNSAAFAFSLFMDPAADLIEVFPDMELMLHYCYITRTPGVRWQRYTNVATVGAPPKANFGNGPFNMIVEDVPHFLAFVKATLDFPREQRVKNPTCHVTPINPFLPND
jgi:hypothetical protein